MILRAPQPWLPLPGAQGLPLLCPDPRTPFQPPGGYQLLPPWCHSRAGLLSPAQPQPHYSRGGPDKHGWGCPWCPPAAPILAEAVAWVQAVSRQQQGILVYIWQIVHADPWHLCSLVYQFGLGQMHHPVLQSPTLQYVSIAIFRLVFIVSELSLIDYR